MSNDEKDFLNDVATTPIRDNEGRCIPRRLAPDMGDPWCSCGYLYVWDDKPERHISDECSKIPEGKSARFKK